MVTNKCSTFNSSSYQLLSFSTVVLPDVKALQQFSFNIISSEMFSLCVGEKKNLLFCIVPESVQYVPVFTMCTFPGIIIVMMHSSVCSCGKGLSENAIQAKGGNPT